MAAARRRKPVEGVRRSVLEVLAQVLTDHRGHLLMDSRFHCLCGWVSDSPSATYASLQGVRQGAEHQALECQFALAANATLEEEETPDEV